MAGVVLKSIVVLLLTGAVKAPGLPPPLLLNLEELARVNECTEYKELNSPDRSVDYTNDTIEKCDAKLTPGWYRFTESAGSHMATRCIKHHYCSAINPGWLDGSHPKVREGVVGRKVCFQSMESCCYGSMKVLVRNCGEFFVYLLFAVPCPFRYCGNHVSPAPELTTLRPLPIISSTLQTTLPPLPPAPTVKPHRISDECHSYTELSSANRSEAFYDPFVIRGDYNLETGWYRFTGKAGNKMADRCVPRFHCGTEAPGWLFGGHPSEATNHTVSRVACFHWKKKCCYFKQNLLVRRCKGYFVYKLRRNTFKYLKYCGNGITEP